MSDDRPLAYHEGDKVIFRGSGLGTCETAMVGLLMGYEAQAFPRQLLEAFQFGHDHEQEVIDTWLALNPIFEVVAQQEEIDYEVAPDIVIRCHTDLVVRHKMTEAIYLLEIKTLGKTLLKAFRDGKLYDKIPSYGTQLDVYRKATAGVHDLEHLPAIYVVMDKDTFKAGYSADHWLFEEYITGPVDLSGVTAKLQRVVELADSGTIPESECKGLCPTPFLHGDFEEAELVTDEELDELALEYHRAKVEEEVAKLAKKEAGSKLKKKLADLGSEKVQTASSRVTLVTQSRSNIDKDAMKAAGIDPAQFEKAYTYDYVRVTSKGGMEDD